jgi:hypothetical protein
VARAWRIRLALGRSGACATEPVPAVSNTWPPPPTSASSVAPICSRSRSSANGETLLLPWVSASRSAPRRALAVSSTVIASSVPLPSDSPASSAPARRTSNQASMLRVTNWYETV